MKTLSKTLKYAGLSTLAAGSRLLKKTSLHDALQRSLASKMTAMKGIPMKVSQVLAMREDESAELFEQAQQDIELMSDELVLSLLAEYSPVFLQKALLQTEKKGASLGQVCHFLRDGCHYAVKLQYPESEDNLDMDNKAFSLVSSTFSNFSKGFQCSEYAETFKEELNLELDYDREARLQQEFFDIFEKCSSIIIPRVESLFSSGRCLVMSWEPSLSMKEFQKQATMDEQKKASALITEFYLQSTLASGLIHADPNPGNFGFRLHGDAVQLVVYDFGSVVKLNTQEHNSLLALFQLVQDGQNPAPALLRLGFDAALLKVIYEQLPALMVVLLQPFFSEQRFEVTSWNRKEKVTDILGDKRWNFMAAAPAGLFMLMRSFYGLFYYTDKLGGGLFCSPQVKCILKEKRQEVLTCLSEQKDSLTKVVQAGLSRYLIISVMENSRQKVKLTFPFQSVDSLSSLVPNEVLQNLKDRNIVIAELVKDVRRSAYRPQVIFSLCDGNKQIKVYLE